MSTATLTPKLEKRPVKQGFSPKPIRTAIRMDDPSPSDSDSRSPEGGTLRKITAAKAKTIPAKTKNGIVTFD